MITSSLKICDHNSSWDPIWENIFATREWGRYPPEELIRFIAKNYYNAPDRKLISVLELGCGAGACLWYLAREGYDVTGIDGSLSGLQKAERLLNRDRLQAKLIQGDIIHLSSLLQEKAFDAVIDVNCLQHLSNLQSVKTVLQMVFKHLNPGGRFFSIAIAAESSISGLEDKGTFHLFTEDGLIEFLQPFEEVEINYSERSRNHQKEIVKLWVSSGRRPLN